jgi:coenzyme F420-reducing hydrogenase beta subunit
LRLSGRIAPPDVYAAWHLDDEIRRRSSSGGVFTALADFILAQGGAVVGAAFDEHLVCHHVMVEDTAGVDGLRGSKYVQSALAPGLYRRIRTVLKDGRTVLFTGTPCQVGGLRAFLGNNQTNLFCCDLVCHGVPSPAWFAKYIRETQRQTTLSGFTFRDKDKGWKQYGIARTWSDGRCERVARQQDPYMASFSSNQSLRESCYACRFASPERVGDLSLADYWRVGTKYPTYDRDDKGTSLVLVNSIKGEALLDRCRDHLFAGRGDLENAISGNLMLVRPTRRPPTRDTFYRDMGIMSVQQLRRTYRLHPPALWLRVLRTAQRRLQALRRVR